MEWLDYYFTNLLTYGFLNNQKIQENIFIFCWIVVLLNGNHPFSVRMQNIFEKNISYPLIHTRTFAYQEVRNHDFSENFAYALNR